MYKRILVGIDDSKTASLALRHAIGLARQQRARLRLVSVVDEAGLDVAPYQTELWDARIKAARALLRKSQAMASASAVKADTKLIEMEGIGQRTAELIVKEAQGWPAELTVVGTHGRRGFSHLVLGSVAEGVIRLSSGPVLLVRGVEAKPKRRRRVSAD